ncbi:MAG: MerR family DNA-binding protein [Proteobacteria bacterium]|nr:MerR family DNA-binding protein [Pseudomonadota bacterium]
MALTISEFARGGGVGVETVRYYQRRGLLTDPRPGSAHGSGRREGGRRHYSDEDLRRLRFIRSAQRAGFSLDEISGLVAPERTRPEVRSLARARIAKLDAQITELQAARKWLAELAQECAAGGPGPCPIIAAFEV